MLTGGVGGRGGGGTGGCGGNGACLGPKKTTVFWGIFGPMHTGEHCAMYCLRDVGIPSLNSKIGPVGGKLNNCPSFERHGGEELIRQQQHGPQADAQIGTTGP